MQKAVDHQTAPKPQPLTKPFLETETKPEDYDLFLAKLERGGEWIFLEATAPKFLSFCIFGREVGGCIGIVCIYCK